MVPMEDYTMTEVPRRRGPPPRRLTPVEPLPKPPMPTAAQYAVITHNLGIKPLCDRSYGLFATELHYYRSIDEMIDSVSSPADAADCEKYNITPSEWHNCVSGVLAHAAWRHKQTLPLTDAEIEMLVAIVDESWRPRLRELMRGGLTFIKAGQLVGAEEEAAAPVAVA
jgi:hypothetical protein